MAAFTFKKYIGVYPNESFLKTALETGKLNTPFLALVGGSINYNDIVYIDMYVNNELECTLQKNPNTNSWVGYSVNVSEGDDVTFKSNGSDLVFVLDGEDYQVWTADTNITNPTLTLTNGEFVFSYTELGNYDIRLLIDNNAYDFEFGIIEEIEVPLNQTIENADSEPVDWYWNGTEVLTQSPHLDKEDIPDYGPQKTVYIEEIEADTAPTSDSDSSDAITQIRITGTVSDASSDDL